MKVQIHFQHTDFWNWQILSRGKRRKWVSEEYLLIHSEGFLALITVILGFSPEVATWGIRHETTVCPIDLTGQQINGSQAVPVDLGVEQLPEIKLSRGANVVHGRLIPTIGCRSWFKDHKLIMLSSLIVCQGFHDMHLGLPGSKLCQCNQFFVSF